MAINDILAKDGRDWTPEERKIVQAALKIQGRQALKFQREDLRNE